MIPILYESTETTFTSNGLGRLSDVISCKVDEKKNGSYELEMKYPVKGIHFDDLIEDRLIFGKPFDGGNNQAFRIYSIEKSLDGNAVVYAEHISYLLNQTTVLPYTASSCAEAIARLPQHFATQSYFTFDTDKEVTGTFELTEPKQVRGVLGGESGSLLDVYGKIEYEFDNFTVHAWLNRGSDNGVTLRYGKNITELTDTGDDQSTYTGIVPFWRGTEEDGETEVVKIISTTPVIWSSHQADFAYPRVIPVDFSQEWQEEPTDQQLIDRANAYINNNSGWKKKQTIDISFVALWQTEEYKNVAALERVKLCDYVTVIYPELGVSDKLQVIETNYDVLLERYNSIKLGSTRTSLVNDVVSIDSKIANVASAVESAKSSLNKAIEHATDLITGGLGGHVVIGTDANGKPNEIYIMNTDSVETATQVLRMNMNGIGFSRTGINGEYYSAWTLDGAFVADWITAGELDAGVITAGVLAGRNNQETWWNMESGEFHLSTGVAQEIAQYVDASGLILYMPYTLTGTIAHFRARVLRGEDDVTYNYPAGSFTWLKKENFVITELGSGYTYNFDLRDFTTGGSIILRLEKMDFFYMLDNDGNVLLDHDGNPLMSMDKSISYDYEYLTDAENNKLTDANGNPLTGRVEVPYISVETDFTSDIKTSELEFTTEQLESRFNHYDGSAEVKTIESVISQKASSISLSVNGTAGKENQSGAGILITLKDENGNELAADSGIVYISGETVFRSQLEEAGQTTINGSNITTGVIKDINENTVFNLSTGELNMKKGSIYLANSSGRFVSIADGTIKADRYTFSSSNSSGITYSWVYSPQYSGEVRDIIWTGGQVGSWQQIHGWGIHSREYNYWGQYGTQGYAPVYCSECVQYSNTSDIKFKKDIEYIDADVCKDITMGIKGVSFVHKTDETNRRRFGIIAQDLKKLIDEHDLDWDIVHYNKETDGLGLEYTELIPVLAMTIQKMQQEIDELKSQVAELQAAQK